MVVTRQYKTFVELDDVKQELMQWSLTRAQYITEQLTAEPASQRKHNEQRIAWQMKRVAERYARKEKAARSGYQTGDEAYYDNATLGQLLPFVLASVVDGTVLEQAQEMLRDGQPKGSSSPAEGGNLLATLLDIKRAYLLLDKEEQTILRLRYHDSFTLAQIAGILECHTATADRRCVSALRKLNEKLGGETPWR
jgi:DNA-directed RNA polymerase specialized sigma24 family protein